MSKAKFAAAKELIDEKKYTEARDVLKTIDHPTAREWEAKLNKIAPQLSPFPFQASSPPPPPPVHRAAVEPQVGMQKMWRTIWGILTLLSIGWMCYGIMASSNAYGEVVSNSSSDAYQAGAAIGAGLGLTFYLCSGVPFFLLFLILYWRNGVAITRAKEHAETINALNARG